MVKLSILSFNYSDGSIEDAKFKKYFIEKYGNICDKIDWSYGISNIYIQIERPEYLDVKSDLKKLHRYIREIYKNKYCKTDLANAEYLKVDILSELLDSPSENRPDLFYNEWKPGSKIYIDQSKELRIRKGSMGKKDIALSWEEEIIISLQLKKALECEDCSGLLLRPVYISSQSEPVAGQIISTNILPKFSHKTKIFEDMDKRQKQYDFISYNYNLDELLYYPSGAHNLFKDFNYTKEYFGQGFYPRHLLIVSQKVREVFEKYKIKGIDYTPIYFED